MRLEITPLCSSFNDCRWSPTREIWPEQDHSFKIFICHWYQVYLLSLKHVHQDHPGLRDTERDLLWLLLDLPSASSWQSADFQSKVWHPNIKDLGILQQQTLFIYLAIVWDLIEHICQVLWAFSRGFHVACPHAFNEFSGLIKWCLYVPIGRYWMTELESCFVNLNLSSSTLTLPITHSTRSNEILCKSSVTNIK